MVPLRLGEAGREGTVGPGGVASLAGARRVLLRRLLERDARSQLRQSRSTRGSEEGRALLARLDGRGRLPARRDPVSDGGWAAFRIAGDARAPARVPGVSAYGE